MMPGPRLFRSRWMALFWAAGIVWFAVDIAGSSPAPHSAAGNNAAEADDADTSAAIKALDSMK
jgi:hypothetical protein